MISWDHVGHFELHHRVNKNQSKSPIAREVLEENMEIWTTAMYQCGERMKIRKRQCFIVFVEKKFNIENANTFRILF